MNTLTVTRCMGASFVQVVVDGLWGVCLCNLGVFEHLRTDQRITCNKSQVLINLMWDLT